jgi:hypothetical protein
MRIHADTAWASVAMAGHRGRVVRVERRETRWVPVPTDTFTVFLYTPAAKKP